MFCKNCGNKLNEGKKFCANCGTPIDNVEETTETNVNKEVVETVNEPIQTQTTTENTVTMNNQNQTPNNNSSDKKNLIILIAIVIILALGFVIGYLLINKDKDKDKDKNKNKNTNEYEDIIKDIPNITGDTKDTDDDDDDWSWDDDDSKTTKDDSKTTTTTTDDNDSEDTITYKDFEFKKLKGYTYSTTSNGLQITDMSDVIVLDVVAGSFDLVKANTDTLDSTFKSQGYDIKNTEVKKYGGVEYITSEVTKDGISMLILYTKANDSYTYVIGVTNTKFTVDYNSITTVNKIISNVSYKG